MENVTRRQQKLLTDDDLNGCLKTFKIQITKTKCRLFSTFSIYAKCTFHVLHDLEVSGFQTMFYLQTKFSYEILIFCVCGTS